MISIARTDDFQNTGQALSAHRNIQRNYTGSLCRGPHLHGRSYPGVRGPDRHPETSYLHGRLLETVYPIIFINAIHFSAKEESVVQKCTTYEVLGIDADGKEGVLAIKAERTKAVDIGLADHLLIYC